MSNSIVIGYRETSSSPILYHYIHWRHFDNIPLFLQSLLKHTHPRWDHGAYATRMAISFTIGTDSDTILSETGSGLYIHEHPTTDCAIIPAFCWGSETLTFFERDTPYTAAQFKFNEFLDREFPTE